MTYKKACVVGWPISHSRSPLIHNHWLQKYGIEGEYTKLALEPENFHQLIEKLKTGEISGANITVPHKEQAFALADHKHESAKAVSAANTLWLEGGKVHAANTDTYGYMTHLETTAPDWNKEDAPVVVIGAGGAARAIIYGLLEANISEVRVLNRTIERAEQIAKEFGERVKVYEWTNSEQGLSACKLLVNTTTLGMTGSAQLEIDLSPLSSDATVSDIVYSPLKTSLLAQAENKNFKTVDGLGMLLHQAVPGFEIWFGKRPEVTDELRNIILKDMGEI